MDSEIQFRGEHELIWNDQCVAIVDGLCFDLFPFITADIIEVSVSIDMRRLIQHIVDSDFNDPTFDQQLLKDWKLVGPHRSSEWIAPLEVDFENGVIEWWADFT